MKNKPLFLLILFILGKTESRAFSLNDSLPVQPKKKIYITFDDGPNKGTAGVLRQVQQDSIPASFFIVGTHTDDSPPQRATWKKLQADSTIELCNHGYSHAGNRYSRYYRNPAAVVKDIRRNQELLQLKNRIVRMPGRNAWRIGSIRYTDIAASKAAIDSVQKAGYDVMGWDLEWSYDANMELLVTPEQLIAQMHNMLAAGTTKTKEHLIVLAHDQAFQTKGALALLHRFFILIKANPDYELALASTYPGILPISK